MLLVESVATPRGERVGRSSVIVQGCYPLKALTVQRPRVTLLALYHHHHHSLCYTKTCTARAGHGRPGPCEGGRDLLGTCSGPARDLLGSLARSGRAGVETDSGALSAGHAARQ